MGSAREPDHRVVHIQVLQRGSAQEQSGLHEIEIVAAVALSVVTVGACQRASTATPQSEPAAAGRHHVMYKTSRFNYNRTRQEQSHIRQQCRKTEKTAYLRGTKRLDAAAPTPGRPCLTGLYVIENSAR